MEILIAGAGIGGLTLALALNRAGIACRVFEASPELRAVGVGINLLPHATAILDELGLLDALARVAVTTREAVFFNRFGQFVHREPAGRFAGYATPQFSIHRGDLQMVLLAAVRERLGGERLHLGWKCTGFEQDARGVTARFADAGGSALERARGDALIACDGLHSTIRRQLHPGEGEPVYSGVNMWRGVTRWRPFLSGASMTRAGWLTPGKLVIYPIRDVIDEEGRQLINWVAEITTPRHEKRDWNRAGRLADFIDVFADWRFDWLDVPAMIRAADAILEFPMIDQDPLPWWTDGRVTLLGDAAHPMVPRGSNGAGQAILDARELAALLATGDDAPAALKAYEARRLPATTQVVLTNRANPPDAILREVWQRTGDKPFARIEDVISHAEIMAISDGYKKVAGYDHASLAAQRA
jgi:2-polyprenyl-6-methoxyphenol hydroxylase-like FAD-dependent oxidoreductase